MIYCNAAAEFTALAGLHRDLEIPATQSTACSVSLLPYDVFVWAMYPGELAFRVEVGRMEFAEGGAGQILSFGHPNILLL